MVSLLTVIVFEFPYHLIDLSPNSECALSMPVGGCRFLSNEMVATGACDFVWENKCRIFNLISHASLAFLRAK